MQCNTPSPAHTAGPWHTDWFCDDRGWILDGAANYLAEIVTTDDEGFVVPPDQQRANARLMAAAPELLEALKDVTACLKDFYTVDHRAAGEHFGVPLLERLMDAIGKTEKAERHIQPLSPPRT